ncbi:hypothetical protein I316_00845 [Kwoniella heveanensis BCC8398]|uniref:Uncharacterized protein n=1 Tax=Kwoniella heveanensis BCC8398 TaxID=1296120 RepID=A0A1B9H369_9TREE|nr:hypothetical protein I316_00845 [Kwoniella heveanensis BCC8398]
MEELLSEKCETLSRQIASTYIGMRPENDPVLVNVFGTTDAAVETLMDAPDLRGQVDGYVLGVFERFATDCDQVNASASQYEDSIASMSMTIGQVPGSEYMGITRIQASAPLEVATTTNERHVGEGLGVVEGAPEGDRSGVDTHTYTLSKYGTFKAPKFPSQYQKKLRKSESNQCSSVAQRLAAEASSRLLQELTDQSYDPSVYIEPDRRDQQLSEFRSEWNKIDWTTVAPKACKVLARDMYTELKDRTAYRYEVERSGTGSMGNIQAVLTLDPLQTEGRSGKFSRKPREGLGEYAVSFALMSTDGYFNDHTARGCTVYLDKSVDLTDKKYRKAD